MAFAMIYYGAAVILLLLCCYVKKIKRFEVLAKAAASLGFILIFTLSAVKSGDYALYFRMLPAFACCFMGDVLLSVNTLNGDKKVFLGGVAAFLVGHIFFVAAFSGMMPFTLSDFLFPAVIVVLTLILTRMKGMNMDGMTPHVTVYAFFVALLLSKAYSIYTGIGANGQTTYLLFGSLLFFLSDFLLLFLIFYKKKPKWGDFANLVLYYGGLLLLAMSVKK